MKEQHHLTDYEEVRDAVISASFSKEVPVNKKKKETENKILYTE